MTRSSSILFICAAALAAIMLAGCGGAKETQKESRIVWPEPPDTPRVAYLRTYRGEDDFSGGIGGVISSLAGKKGVVKLARPFDVCLAADGRFYVTDAMQGVLLFDAMKKEVSVLGEHSSVELKDPRGIAYAHGKVFIGLAGSGKVVVLDNEGGFVRAIGRQGEFGNPVDLVCDTLRNRLYVVDSKLHQVFVYSEAGDSLFTIGRRGTGDGEFNFPQSAAVDASGNLYVVDSFNFRVEVFDSTGKFLRTFGKQGDAFGTFARPKGIALDSFGNIYVLDGLHNNFQIFNSAGELLMFVGRYSPDNYGFEDPVSIAIDRTNAIYVTDNLNGRVQVFQLLVGHE
jgi:DNA-binding beta-propeller fold protein YncE